METWGQGPWFELERDDDGDDDAAAGAAEGPLAADAASRARPSHDDAVSHPPATPPDALQTRDAEAVAADAHTAGTAAGGADGLDATLANIFDLDANADADADVRLFPGGDSVETFTDTFRDAITRPPHPSPPASALPDSYPFIAAPARPIAPSSPVTRKPPVLASLSEYTYDDFLRRSSAHEQSVSAPLAPTPETETSGPAIWRTWRTWRTWRLPTPRILWVTLTVLLLVLTLSAGLLAVASPLRLLATPFGAPPGAPVATTAAVVSLTPATQPLTATDDLTSCPSGCDLTGQTFSASRTFSKQASATQIPQTTLSGTIQVSNTGLSDWGPVIYQFKGGEFTCNPRTVYVPAGTPQDYSCVINAASPSTVPAHTIHGTVSGFPNVTFDQTVPLVGNGSYQVTSADCQAALADTKTTQGVAWAASWQSGQSIPAGWQWAQSAPATSFGNDSCPVNQQQASPFTFTASSSTTASNNAYNPAAAQSLAKNRLNSRLPSGYAWKRGDPSTCPVTVTASSGAHVTLACPASGTAVYAWSDALKAELVAKLLGKTKDDALAACNSAAGVRANSCAITLRAGLTSLPDAAKDVTIQINQP